MASLSAIDSKVKDEQNLALFRVERKKERNCIIESTTIIMSKVLLFT